MSLNLYQIAPHFQGNAYFIKISTDQLCTMVSIDFVSDSQQMKLYDYVEQALHFGVLKYEKQHKEGTC